MSQPTLGALICKAGRGIKCIHKRNSAIVGGDIKTQTCGVNATPELCKYVGKALIEEVITGESRSAVPS